MKTLPPFAAFSLSLLLYGWRAEAADAELASYTLKIPPDISPAANHLIHGKNEVAEILSTVPEGTLLYKFDSTRNIYTVNQFQFGAWLRPEETLAPGEGALIRNPGKEFSITFSGNKPASAQFPALNDRWTLLSLPAPGETSIPTPNDGDNLYRFDPFVQGFFIHTFDGVDQAWAPRLGSLRLRGDLMTNFGESFFYQNVRRPRVTVEDGTVYFSTYLPGTVTARIQWDNGVGIGQGFTAQLYGGPAGTPIEQLSPLTPLTTFQTASAAAAGYVKPVLVTIPGVRPNTSGTLVMRVFDGASFETSRVRGESAPINVRVGGLFWPPGLLTDLPGFTFPAPAGSLGVERMSNGLRLTFNGTLQSADAVTGPYVDVVAATSPLNITFSGPAKFYRIKP